MHEELPPQAKQSPLALPIPLQWKVGRSQAAQVMVPPTALEANWWLAPHEPLMHEELPPRAKQSLLALPTPSEWEVVRSRLALVMVALMALGANWWWLPRPSLMHEKFPPRGKTRLLEPWAQARPEVQLLRPAQFRPG
jgi:hypothetical protein